MSRINSCLVFVSSLRQPRMYIISHEHISDDVRLYNIHACKHVAQTMFGFSSKCFGNDVKYKQHITHIKNIQKHMNIKLAMEQSILRYSLQQHLDRSAHFAEQITLAKIHLLIAGY